MQFLLELLDLFVFLFEFMFVGLQLLEMLLFLFV